MKDRLLLRIVTAFLVVTGAMLGAPTLSEAQSITYTLTGNLKYVFGPETLGLDGAPLTVNVALFNPTPGPVIVDPNFKKRTDYVALGALTIGSLAPKVERIDVIFADSLSDQNDETGFAVRTIEGDFLLGSTVGPFANDSADPPPVYPTNAVLVYSRLLIPGATAIQNVGYDLVNPQLTASMVPSGACSSSITPLSQSFGANGGVGQIAVTTPSGCFWTATTNADWIAVQFGGACRQVGDVVVCSSGIGTVTFWVTANSSAPRNGTITVAGRTFPISQGGITCSPAINPTRSSLGNPGGSRTIALTTANGCNWNVSTDVSWITITSARSGAGSASIRFSVAANTGSPRTGTLTMAGLSHTVRQDAGACGALDVSHLTFVFRSTPSWIYPSSYLYSSDVRITNTSSQPILGPLFLVLVGLPNNASYPRQVGLIGNQLITRCFSPSGDYMIPFISSGAALNPRQSRSIPLVFFTQLFGTPILYSTKIVSGMPSQ